MFKFRKYVLLFFLGNLSFFLAICVIEWIVDPFCIFHKHYFKWQQYILPEILTNLGQIETFLKRTQDYDTILVSSSLMKNTYAKDIAFSVKSNKKALKLCLPGAFPEEIDYMVRMVAKNHSVKNIILCFDIYQFSYPAHTPHWYRKFPYSLYNNRYLIFFSYLNLKHSFKSLLLKSYEPESSFKDLDDLYFYYNFSYIKRQKLEFLSDRHINDLKKSFHLDLDNFNSIYCNADFSSIDTHLIPLLKENPNINFYIPIMPYSVLHWGNNKGERLDTAFLLQRHLVKKCKNLNNVKIYGFFDCNFVVNIGNYIDDIHFHPNINQYILYSIRNNIHYLKCNNFDNYEKNSIRNLRTFQFKDHYDLNKDIDTFQHIVESNAGKELDATYVEDCFLERQEE